MISQADIWSSQQLSSPEYIICAHQTRARADTANKNKKIAIFDYLNLQNNYVEIDGKRYPRDSVLVSFEQNDYFEQYKDLNLFFKEFVVETLMTPFIHYPDMKIKYSIEIIDLGHQRDHITPEKIQLFHA